MYCDLTKCVLPDITIMIDWTLKINNIIIYYKRWLLKYISIITSFHTTST